MPVCAEEVSGLHSSTAARLPLVRQVFEWVYHPDKKVEDQQQQQQRRRLVDEQLLEEEPGLSMAAASVANAADAAAAVAAKCPYSAVAKNPVPYVFQMPLHYPRYTKADYEAMPEWQLDRLLEEYGLAASLMGNLKEKRDYAIGAFLWREA